MLLHRSHFFSGKKLNAHVVANHKKISMRMLKFIARQHLCLTGIVDKLNTCFSFQVDFSILYIASKNNFLLKYPKSSFNK